MYNKEFFRPRYSSIPQEALEILPKRSTQTNRKRGLAQTVSTTRAKAFLKRKGL